MAFANKVGNLLKQAITSNPSVYRAIRCMSSSKIFIGGVSYGTDDQSLREAFSSYGEVVEARIIIDRETGRSRGFGFVTFTSGEEASAAITGMDGKDLHGRIVRVNYANDRTRGYGGYGGGGGGNYGGDSYSSGGGGYGSSSGGYGGNNYGSGGGGYGGGSGSGSYNVAGGGGGGRSDNYVSGDAGDNYASSGGVSEYGRSGPMGYGNGNDQITSNPSSAGGGYDNGRQDDLLDDSFKDGADEPDDYANRRG